jgi:5-carboxymethyl-2-hydroxymuconate isomerase
MNELAGLARRRPSMPHLIVEYSANLDEAVDLRHLVATLHAAALKTGVFPIGGIRIRVARREVYLIADGNKENAFIHLTARIGEGRDLATKRRAGEAIFAALCDELAPVFAARGLGISFDIVEIAGDLSFKKNNLHEHVAAREKARRVQPEGV